MKYALSASAAVAVAALVITGCSGDVEAGSRPTVTETVTETATIAPDPKPAVTETVTITPEPPQQEPAAGGNSDLEASDTSPRGNLTKAMGEHAGILDAGGKPIATFTVHSIKEGACTEPMSEPPENGHYMFLDVSLTTATDLVDEYGPEFGLTGAWEVINSGGQTSNAMLESFGAFTCLPETELLPSWLGPGESARGIVVLDTPYPKGTFMFHDLLDTVGWEWKYPGN